jgi:DNA-binding PadR family transcriptional regulator
LRNLSPNEREVQEIEAENARVKDELAALKSQRGSMAREERRCSLSRNCLIFDREVACRVGLSIAIVLERLRWLLTLPCSGKVLSDGRKYVFNTYSDWQKNHFPFWSERKVERVFTEGEHKGLIISRQPEGRASRRKYYALTPEGAKLAASGTTWRLPSNRNGAFLIQRMRILSTLTPNADANRPRNTTAPTLAVAEELREQYPRHDVKAELTRYTKFCRARAKQLTAEGFKR